MKSKSTKKGIGKNIPLIKKGQALPKNPNMASKDLGKWVFFAIESAPFGVMVHDSEGKILLFNSQLETISGYRKEEIPDTKTWIEKLYPDQDYRNLVIKDRNKMIQPDRLRIRKAIITAKDGKKRSCEFSSILSSSGIRTVFIKDTHTLRETEESLRESEERFRLLSEAAFEGILIHKDGVILQANDQFFNMFGYKEQDLLGQQGIPMLIAPESVNFIRKQIRDKATEPYEIMGRKIDGTTFPIQIHAKSVQYQDNEVRVAAIKDLTNSRHAESALLESERRFRDMAANIPEVFWLFDWPNQKVDYVSPAYEKIWGRRVEDLYENYDEWARSIHPEDLTNAQSSFDNILKTGGGETREYRIIRPDGSVRWISDRGFAIYNKKGKIKRIAGIAADITKRKEIQRKLDENEQELRSHAKNLREVNTALKVLIEQREAERDELKQNLMMNVKKRIFPYIERMESKHLDEDTKLLVTIIKSNLDDIIAPLSSNLSSKYFELTPSEIQTADLIKQGKTSKEIATLLHVSPKAISFHRGNIRKKLGLNNRKINLRTYLQSFPK